MYIEAMPILLRSLALPTDYGHTMAKLLILCGPNWGKFKFKSQSQINIWDVDTGYKGLVFCRYNGWFIEDMGKGLTVPKIHQMPQNFSAQIVCPSPKVWDFDEKRLHWASVVRGPDYSSTIPPTASKVWNSLPGLLGSYQHTNYFSESSECVHFSKYQKQTIDNFS